MGKSGDSFRFVLYYSYRINWFCYQAFHALATR